LGFGAPKYRRLSDVAQYLYNGTHSSSYSPWLSSSSGCLARKPVWVVGAWGLHIMIDIPTHSLELFNTLPLAPLRLQGDGVAWAIRLCLCGHAVALCRLFAMAGRKKRQRRLPSIHTGDAQPVTPADGLTLRARLAAERRRSVTRYMKLSGYGFRPMGFSACR